MWKTVEHREIVERKGGEVEEPDPAGLQQGPQPQETPEPPEGQETEPMQISSDEHEEGETSHGYLIPS